MKSVSRYSGTLRAVKANWPAYFLTYSGIVLALIIIGLSAQRGWIGLISLNLAFLIILIYLLLTRMWIAHLLNDLVFIQGFDA